MPGTKAFTMRIDDDLMRRIDKLTERRYVMLYGPVEGKVRHGFISRAGTIRWLLEVGLAEANKDLDQRQPVGKKGGGR